MSLAYYDYLILGRIGTVKKIVPTKNLFEKKKHELDNSNVKKHQILSSTKIKVNLEKMLLADVSSRL